MINRRGFHPEYAGAPATARLLTCLLVSGLSGCHAGPEHEARQLPSLKVLQSARQAAHPKGSAHRNERTFTNIYRIHLPLDGHVERAWSFVKPVNNITARWWWRNGIRTGVLTSTSRQALLESLPDTFGFTNQRLIGGHDAVTLIESKKTSKPYQLIMPGREMEGETVVLRGGQCQLLLRIVRLGGNRFAIELTPHHHVTDTRWFTVQKREVEESDDAGVNSAIAVRTPEERALDGRILKELTMTVELAPGQSLVLGFQDFHAGNDHVDTEAMHTADIDQDQHAPGAGHGFSGGDHIETAASHLGRAILTARRGRRAIQTLLLIDSPQVMLDG